jgi:uncharacterized protein (TIGR02996 family)
MSENGAMKTDDGFLKELLANPGDRTTRLVYADWLDEQGDLRGEFLRLELRLTNLPADHEERETIENRLRQLREGIDRDWLARLDQAPIEACVQFSFACPQRWEKLTPTGNDRVRFCDSCQKQVYHCNTVLEGQRHARRGNCVAIDSRLVRTEGDLTPAPFREYGMTVGVIIPDRMDWEEPASDAGLQEGEEGQSTEPERPRHRWWQFWKRSR